MLTIENTKKIEKKIPIKITLQDINHLTFWPVIAQSFSDSYFFFHRVGIFTYLVISLDY